VLIRVQHSPRIPALHLCTNFHVPPGPQIQSCISKPFPKVTYGRLRKATEGYGRLRKATEGYGRLRKASEGFGRLRKASEGFGRLRKASEGFGRLRKASEGYGRLRKASEGFDTYRLCEGFPGLRKFKITVRFLQNSLLLPACPRVYFGPSVVSASSRSQRGKTKHLIFARRHRT
jgi:hypothetical protein